MQESRNYYTVYFEHNNVGNLKSLLAIIDRNDYTGRWLGGHMIYTTEATVKKLKEAKFNVQKYIEVSVVAVIDE